MANSIIYKFRLMGMNDSKDVASVRTNLASIPGVGSISVSLQKMQVEVTASRPIETALWRKALTGTDFNLSELTTSVKQAPPEIRDDYTGER